MFKKLQSCKMVLKTALRLNYTCLLNIHEMMTITRRNYL